MIFRLAVPHTDKVSPCVELHVRHSLQAHPPSPGAEIKVVRAGHFHLVKDALSVATINSARARLRVVQDPGRWPT